MKRFFFKLSAFILALTLPFAAFIFYLQSLPNLYEGSLMGITSKKLTLLSQLSSPKMIVVGGSGAPYGVVCADVQDALDMPCFNLGSTAYVGMPFLLKQVRSSAKKGDIVVLAPEYIMYAGERSYTTVWCALENHANVWANVPLSYWPGLLGSCYGFAKDKLALYRAKGAPEGNIDTHYAEAGLGPLGDHVQPRENILEHKYNTEDCRTVEQSTLTDEMLRELNRFARWAKAHDVTVYLTYAPFNRLALLGTADDPTGLCGVDALQERLLAECDIPWLGTLREGIMSEDYFYNSNNHLNTAGAKLRTADLIADLQAAGMKSDLA
ncbi:MAG: hypothetical protein RR215_00670 [Ruthenibacterium sp.]